MGIRAEDGVLFLQHVLRYWMAGLSPSQMMVVLFVFDRTRNWGKMYERITVDQITNGVVGQDGKVWSVGTGIGRTVVKECLAYLVNAGALRKTAKGGHVYLGVNSEWQPMLKVPKKPANMDGTRRLAVPRVGN